MSEAKAEPARRAVGCDSWLWTLREAFVLCLLSLVGMAVHAADPLMVLPTAQAVLAALSPPTTLEKLESGNDVLLDFPDIVRSGKVKIRLMSAMPRTDAMWLISLAPPPNARASLPYSPSGKKVAAEAAGKSNEDVKMPGALLARFSFKANDLPEEFVDVDLETTQTLLLVVRSGGRYFGVRREVKVGYADGSTRGVQ